jgi:hypothetical protein
MLRRGCGSDAAVCCGLWCVPVLRVLAARLAELLCSGATAAGRAASWSPIGQVNVYASVNAKHWPIAAGYTCANSSTPRLLLLLLLQLPEHP